MLTIDDVERVLSEHPWLKPPKNIIYVLEEVYTYHPEYGTLFFRGLQPNWLRDTIVIVAPLATEETVVHEVLHTYGLGETATHMLAPKLRIFREVFKPFIKREIKYRECSYCEEFKIIHTKFKDKIKHYVLVEG